jgi:hypothetical protein
MQWNGNTATVFLYMETHPDDFKRVQHMDSRPIGIIERRARELDPKVFLTHSKLRLKDVIPDTDQPNVPVHGYQRPDAEAKIIERVRAKLAGMLSAHLRRPVG